MPNYGYSIFTFRIHKHSERATPLQLGDLHGDGTVDALPVLGAVLNGMREQRCSEKRKHIRILSTSFHGRSVRFTAEIGNSGQRSTFHDPDADDDTTPVFERDDRHIEVDDRRGVVLVPARGVTGLLVLEARGRSTGKDQLEAVVKRTLRAHHETSGLIMDFNPVVDAEALEKYLEDAAVQAITLRRTGVSKDIAEAVTGEAHQDEEVGKIVMRIDPGGHGPFRRSLAKALRRDHGRRRQLLEVHGIGFQELNVAMDVGDRQINLSMTADRVPSFVYQIARERPEDRLFYREVAGMIPDVGKAVGMTVGPGWQDGHWSEEAAERAIPTVTKEASREQSEEAA